MYIRRLKRTTVQISLKRELNYILISILIWFIIIAFVLRINSYRGIPVLACIMFGLAFIVHFIANYSRFGRYVYAVGGNSDAAYLSGIDVKGITMRVFAVMGALMAIAGIVMTTRIWGVPDPKQDVCLS